MSVQFSIQKKCLWTPVQISGALSLFLLQLTAPQIRVVSASFKSDLCLLVSVSGSYKNALRGKSQ